VFGEKFGKVLQLNQAKIDELQKEEGGLRKAFEESSIAIMTYSAWSSLFSSSMASLLAYSGDASQETKDMAEHNRKVLKDAGIELRYETKRGETKVQFKDATQMREAIEALIANGQGLEKTDIPLEKISMMIGDEADYAYMIPASALASASGSYSAVSQFAGYYEYLAQNRDLTAEQQEALASKFSVLGITAEQISADIKMSEAQLKAKADLYSEISADIINLTKNGKKQISAKRKAAIIAKYSRDARALNTVEGSIEKTINDQIESVRMLSALTQLKEGIEIGDKKYSIAELAKGRAEYKGEYGIDERNIVVNGEIDSEEARAAQAADGSVQMSDVLNPIIEETVRTETEEQRSAESEQIEKLTQEQLEEIVDKLADLLMAQYPGLFSNKTEIKETILTGVSAYEMFAMKQAGLGTGGYIVDTDVTGAKVVRITNNGKPVDNLNMPGMWAIELAEVCESVSKPSVETFISSKEAIAAFEWSIGFSGTFSAAVEGLTKDLGFTKGGSQASAMNLGVTSALVRDQADIPKIIERTHRGFYEQGVASVEFILTPNSDMTASMVEQLIAAKVPAEQIVSLSVATVDADLKSYEEASQTHTDAQYKENLAKALKDKDITKLTMQEKMALMMELLKIKVKSGYATYIVLDVDNGGRGLNFSDMKGAVEGIKKLNGETVNQEKVQATLWAVNFEKMDGTQYEQAVGRIDHRGAVGSASRFSDSVYHRDIVQITSVESARENQVVREAAKAKDWKYCVDLILDNLNEIQFQNEQDKLAKAGNAASTSASSRQEKVAAISRQSAQNNLEAQGLSAQEAGRVIDAIANSVDDKSRKEGDAKLTEKETIAVENYTRFLEMSKGLIADYDIEKMNEYLLDEAAALNDVISGNVNKALEVIKNSRQKTTDKFDRLAEATSEIDAKYEAALEKYRGIISNMSEKERGILQAAQGNKKLSRGDARILKRTGIIEVNKELNDLAKKFDEAAKDIGLTLDRNTGAINYRMPAKPVSQTAQVAADEAAAAAQSPVAAVSEGVRDTAVRSIDGVEVPVSKACLVAAADAVGRPLTQEIIGKVLQISGVENVEISEAEDLLAAGTKEDIVLPMRTLNHVGLKAVSVSVERLEESNFKGTMIAYMNNGEDAVGHAVAVKSIKDGNVVYIDNGVESKVSAQEFKERGYSGLMWVTKYGKNKLENEEVKVAGSTLAEKFGKEIAEEIVDGVMEAGSFNQALMYMLNIYPSVEAMKEALGVEKLSDKEIMSGYFNAINRAAESGLSADDTAVEIQLLSLVRDTLITLSKSEAGTKGKIEELLNKEELNINEIAYLNSQIVISKAVNKNVVLLNTPEMKTAVDEDEELSNALAGLQKTIEKKQESKFLLFSKKADMGAVLPELKMSGDKKLKRGTMMSPMMMKAISAAA
jgi:hypothetical protein